ncbi:MBL fold metallo-hydrolase [Nocardia sp. XZ_19_369]|uniref:MBL fold metallo-hydrolase n=1 Tax=Nocardia sp. XZ_19_369 TaxID=2769487 RepID=UPI001890B58F|nr:MBL fold metallo-hydrolase [Nocardia sp. XZ_19_369]
MSTVPFTHGLHPVGTGSYAYLHPTGTWCQSNSGLVVDQGQALLVDTGFALREAQKIKQSITDALPDITIGTVVNSHGDVDHWFGNQLFADEAEIVASHAAIAHMQQDHWWNLICDPELPTAAPGVRDFLDGICANFDFTDTEPTPATRGFDQELQLQVGRRTVQLLEMGPAHTVGDVLVHVPDARVIYAGDLLFADNHPVIHSGPIQRWIDACTTMLDLDPAVIVPGHGPVVSAAGLILFRDYLERIRDHATDSWRAGDPADHAAATFTHAPTEHWAGADRVLANIAAVYRELAPQDDAVPSALQVLGHTDIAHAHPST